MLLFLWGFIYSFAYATRLGWRVQCDNENIIFRCLIKKTTLKWEDILSYRFNYARNAPNVFLIIRTSQNNKKYIFDVSGMSPDYQKLETKISKMTPRSKALRPNGLMGVSDVDFDLQ